MLVLLQITWLLIELTVGVGFTVIFKLELEPTHVTPAFVKDGITPIVALRGVVPVFDAGKGAMLPVPELAKPIDVLEFVHANDVPVPLKVIKLVFVPLQKVKFDKALTTGMGFTVIVNVSALPGQVTLLFVNCGVTVIVEVSITEFEEFNAVNPLIFPIPLAASPVVIEELTQV